MISKNQIKNKMPTSVRQKLPDDSSLEDIQYHLYVLQKIERGLKESKMGKGYTSDEMRINIRKWLIK